LAEFFGIQMASELGLDNFPGWTREAEAALLGYPWPGNVRELRHVVERNLYQQEDPSAPIQNWVFDPFERPDEQARASRLTGLDREPGMHSSSDDLPLKEAIANLERTRLLDALHASRWHQARAAERLGLSYHQMRALLRKYPDIKKP